MQKIEYIILIAEILIDIIKILICIHNLYL